jgi:DNA-binding LytR/AlgR family response regulator
VVLTFRWLKTKPQIIFITSKAEYAMKAFDYDATDYLQNQSRLIDLMLCKRAIELYQLKSDTKKKKNIFSLKVI